MADDGNECKLQVGYDRIMRYETGTLFGVRMQKILLLHDCREKQFVIGKVC